MHCLHIYLMIQHLYLESLLCIKNVYTSPDVDFPVDLEESFNSGSLVSTLNTSTAYSPPPALGNYLSPSLSLQNYHLQSHMTTNKLRGKVKEVVPAQPSSYQASHNSVPVVPDRDEFLLDSVVDSWNGSNYTTSSLL